MVGDQRCYRTRFAPVAMHPATAALPRIFARDWLRLSGFGAILSMVRRSMTCGKTRGPSTGAPLDNEQRWDRG